MLLLVVHITYLVSCIKLRSAERIVDKKVNILT
jgi:hypothetical protein